MSTKFTYGTQERRDVGGGGQVDYTPLHDKSLVLRYNGFRMDNGRLWSERMLGFDYIEQGGRIFKKDDLGTPLHPDDAATKYVRRVWMSLQVVKPLTHFEVRLSLPLSVKGWTMKGDSGFEFWPEPNSGLMRAVIACGFNWRLADGNSDFHDISYVSDRLEANCVLPLTEDQVILGVFDPIMQEYADSGHLVEGHTKPQGAWLQWKQAYGFLQPITDKAILDRIWKEVEELPKGTPEPEIPFDEPVVATGISVETMILDIAEAVAGNHKCALTGDHTIKPNPRLLEVFNLIKRFEPAFEGRSGMLARCKPSTLSSLYAAVFPSEDEGEEGSL